jgi:hypothetical protein
MIQMYTSRIVQVQACFLLLTYLCITSTASRPSSLGTSSALVLRRTNYLPPSINPARCLPLGTYHSLHMLRLLRLLRLPLANLGELIFALASELADAAALCPMADVP